MKGKEDEFAEAREFTAISSANKMDVTDAYNSNVEPAVDTFYKVNCLVSLKIRYLYRSAINIGKLLYCIMPGTCN